MLSHVYAGPSNVPLTVRDEACRLPVSPLCALFCCASSAHAPAG